MAFLNPSKQMTGSQAQTRACLFNSTSFPIHCLPSTVQFDTLYSELPTMILNKLYIKGLMKMSGFILQNYELQQNMKAVSMARFIKLMLQVVNRIGITYIMKLMLQIINAVSMTHFMKLLLHIVKTVGMTHFI
jgi:hypothetical protein